MVKIVENDKAAPAIDLVRAFQRALGARKDQEGLLLSLRTDMVIPQACAFLARVGAWEGNADQVMTALLEEQTRTLEAARAAQETLDPPPPPRQSEPPLA
jgi:hypothetical protein